MSPKRPVGRRPGDPEDTKRAILGAARALFARHGFERTTIRAVASEADVDPALVMHHFGTKQGLFVAAHEIPVDPATLLGEVATLPVDERGRWIARTYLAAIAGPGSPMLSLLRAAATNDEAAAMLREYIEGVLLSHAAELVTGPHPEARMGLIGSHLFGLLFAREVLGVAPLRDLDLDQLVDLVGPTIQRYLDGP